MNADNVQHWTVRASNYIGGRGRPVRLGINRGLKSGKLDFVALTDDEAWALIAGLVEALDRSKRIPDPSFLRDQEPGLG